MFLSPRLTLLFAVVSLCASFPVSTPDLRFICFGDDNCAWMTLEQALLYRQEHGHDCSDFVDFTNHPDLQKAPDMTGNGVNRFPSGPSHQNVIKPLLSLVSKDNLNASVSALSSYKNRYYQSDTGRIAMEWVKSQFDAISGINATLFQHDDYPQPSVIARIEGSSKSDEVVVIGAHGDSIAGMGGVNVDAPGADDDASGVANLLEVARVIAASGVKPARSIEFMVYAAEEVGLLGSLDIATAYKNNKTKVHAVYQIEMSGYQSTEVTPAVLLISDFVDKGLLSFTKSLVDEYLTLPAQETKCGYGCSDHYSWQKNSASVVCAAEAGPFDPNLNPNMHTARDTVSQLNFDHCQQFAQLALAFGLELAL